MSGKFRSAEKVKQKEQQNKRGFPENGTAVLLLIMEKMMRKQKTTDRKEAEN